MEEFEDYDTPNTPPHSKKVFSGVLFDVFQWEQKMFDGTTRTFEKIWRKPSIQIITITKNKEIILLNEKQPGREKFISLPGGQVEKDEKIIESAKKELLEETGMKARKIKFHKKVSLMDKIDWRTYYFIAYDCKKIQEQKLGAGEDIKIIKTNFEEFIEYTQRDDFRNTHFKNYIFKIIHTPGKLEEFKKLIFKENP